MRGCSVPFASITICEIHKITIIFRIWHTRQKMCNFQAWKFARATNCHYFRKFIKFTNYSASKQKFKAVNSWNFRNFWNNSGNIQLISSTQLTNENFSRKKHKKIMHFSKSAPRLEFFQKTQNSSKTWKLNVFFKLRPQMRTFCKNTFFERIRT